jgi:hypothetical protein
VVGFLANVRKASLASLLKEMARPFFLAYSASSKSVLGVKCAEVFGLEHGNVAFLSHCGSHGFGHDLASGQFKDLQAHFEKRGTPLPAGDRQLVYAPLGTP